MSNRAPFFLREVISRSVLSAITCLGGQARMVERGEERAPLSVSHGDGALLSQESWPLLMSK